MIDAQKVDVIVVACQLPPRCEPQYTPAIALPKLEHLVTDRNNPLAQVAHSGVEKPNDAAHTDLDVCEGLIVLDAETFQVLEQIEDDFPRLGGIREGRFQLEPRPPQLGV